MTAHPQISGDEPAKVPLARALPLAARELERLDREGRRILERDLADALGAQLPASEVERRLSIPGWDPQPGNVDLFQKDANGQVEWAAEVKLKATNDLYECIWDMAKMAWLATTPSVTDVFIVAGTTERWWRKPFAAAGLFDEGSQELVGEIERIRPWWTKYILGDSAGRPSAVPRRIFVEPVAEASLTLSGEEWRIQAQRISAEPTDPGEWVSFSDGLPVVGKDRLP